MESCRGFIEKSLDAEGIEYDVDEGGGAFYGPKIDLKVKDALGRSWQLSTIQFDFNEPERFDMTFVDHDGKEKDHIWFTGLSLVLSKDFSEYLLKIMQVLFLYGFPRFRFL